MSDFLIQLAVMVFATVYGGVHAVSLVNGEDDDKGMRLLKAMLLAVNAGMVGFTLVFLIGDVQ